ncbi:MAG TPA: hypothetical protein VN768_05545 [Acidimicrobiales bacterium]|nr:hypothetical protein [Acidimicrobiales bacterium]
MMGNTGTLGRGPPSFGDGGTAAAPVGEAAAAEADGAGAGAPTVVVGAAGRLEKAPDESDPARAAVPPVWPGDTGAGADEVAFELAEPTIR